MDGPARGNLLRRQLTVWTIWYNPPSWSICSKLSLSLNAIKSISTINIQIDVLHIMCIDVFHDMERNMSFTINLLRFHALLPKAVVALLSMTTIWLWFWKNRIQFFVFFSGCWSDKVSSWAYELVCLATSVCLYISLSWTFMNQSCLMLFQCLHLTTCCLEWIDQTRELASDHSQDHAPLLFRDLVSEVCPKHPSSLCQIFLEQFPRS